MVSRSVEVSAMPAVIAISDSSLNVALVLQNRRVLPGVLSAVRHKNIERLEINAAVHQVSCINSRPVGSAEYLRAVVLVESNVQLLRAQ